MGTPIDFRPLEGDERQREIERLQGLDRRRPATTHLLGRPLELADNESFLWTWTDVLLRGMYDFTCDHDAPRIIDGGSNIGLSILFFRIRFPNARITGFEPAPDVFPVLTRNLAAWGQDDVELIEAALSSEEGTSEFLTDHADAGRQPRAGEADTCTVRTVRLRDWLTEPIDMMKLDLEGAETDVLRDCADRLHHVRNIYVGYHGFIGEPQTLDVVIRILNDAGFRVALEAEPMAPNPLKARHEYLGMDTMVAVFGYRP